MNKSLNVGRSSRFPKAPAAQTSPHSPVPSCSVALLLLFPPKHVSAAKTPPSVWGRPAPDTGNAHVRMHGAPGPRRRERARADPQARQLRSNVSVLCSKQRTSLPRPTTAPQPPLGPDTEVLPVSLVSMQNFRPPQWVPEHRSHASLVLLPFSGSSTRPRVGKCWLT